MPLVRGRVVDAEGAPVPGATVYFVSGPVPLPDVALQADSSGEFVLAAPAPGRYRLGGRADAAGAGEVDLELPAQGDVRVVLPLKS